jgi:hypothetical protein
MRCLARFQTASDIAFDVFHHDDRIVHHDAYREHQPEQRQRVQRVAECLECRERADDGHRHGDDRNDGGAPFLQKQHHDQHHEQRGFEQGFDHLVYRLSDEHRRVVDDRVVDPLRKALLERGHRGTHILRQFQRVGARLQKHRHRHRGAIVEQAAQRVFARTHLHASNLA